jgi:hypothetical protein
VKTLTGFYPNRLLRYLPQQLLAPISAIVKRSLATPLVDANHESAYEYIIEAQADESYEV